MRSIFRGGVNRECTPSPKICSLRSQIVDPPSRGGLNFLDQLPHRHSSIGHAVGEAPFVVVPGHDDTNVPSITLV